MQHHYNTMSGQTGWEKERDAFKNGGGSYYVAPPSESMNNVQLAAGYQAALTTAKGIENRLPDFKSGNNQGPMNEIIAMLLDRAASYEAILYQRQLAQQQANNPPATTPTPGAPLESGTPGETSKGGPFAIILNNPIPSLIIGGAVAFIIYKAVKNRKKRRSTRKR